MPIGIDQNQTSRALNPAYLPSGKVEKRSCCISDCWSRIWKCVVRALNQFVNGLCFRSPIAKPHNPNSSVSSKPAINVSEPSTEVPEPVLTQAQMVPTPGQATNVSEPGREVPEPVLTQVQTVPTPGQSTVNTPSMIAQSNATVAEFVACVPDYSVKAPQVQEFVDRGGILYLAIQEKEPIVMGKNEHVITACSAGMNRSQVAAAVLKNRGVDVTGVLSGRLMRGEITSSSKGFGITSLFTDPPDQYVHFFPDQFSQVFGMKKWNQIGRDFVVSLPIEEPENDRAKIREEQAKRAVKIQEFFQKYIDELGPTHFVTFTDGVSEVLKYLLRRKGSLANFTISYSPMADGIQGAYSAETFATAYRTFGEIIQSRFSVT